MKCIACGRPATREFNDVPCCEVCIEDFGSAEIDEAKEAWEREKVANRLQ